MWEEIPAWLQDSIESEWKIITPTEIDYDPLTQLVQSNIKRVGFFVEKSITWKSINDLIQFTQTRYAEIDRFLQTLWTFKNNSKRIDENIYWLFVSCMMLMIASQTILDWVKETEETSSYLDTQRSMLTYWMTVQHIMLMLVWWNSIVIQQWISKALNDLFEAWPKSL